MFNELLVKLKTKEKVLAQNPHSYIENSKSGLFIIRERHRERIKTPVCLY